MFFVEQIKNIKKYNKKELIQLICGFGISIIALTILILTLRGGTSNNPIVFTTKSINKNLIDIFFKKITTNLIGKNYNNAMIYKLIIVLFLPTIIYGIYRHPKTSILGFSAIIWQLIVFLVIYSDFAAHKTNTIFLVIIFIAWLVIEENKNLNYANNKTIQIYTLFLSGILLILSDISGIQLLKDEITRPYTDASNVAKFINNEIGKESIFICTNMPRASAILPYTNNIKLLSPVDYTEFTYVTWNDNAYKYVQLYEIIDNMNIGGITGKDIYLLESVFDEEESELIKKYQNENILSEVLYASDMDKVIGDESYRIYKINK